MQKVILVGFGFMGTMHAQIYEKLEQAHIVAVVDKARGPAQEAMNQLQIDAPIFEDLRTALAHVECDVVDICLPTDLHVDNALIAIAAGKHFFCEKPLALSPAEGRKVAQAAHAAGVTAQVGQCIRFWPEYVAFKEFVSSGEAGALLSLSLQRRSALPTHSMEQWIIDPSRSGGAALDLHIHDTDFVLYLLGKPKAVHSITRSGEPGASQIFTHYLYDEVSVAAEGGWNYPPNWGFQMAFQAVFENGAVEYDSGAEPTLTATIGQGKKGPMPYRNPSIGRSSTGTGNISALGGYFNELQSFIGALEAEKPPETATLEDAVVSLEVVAAELKSAQTGEVVSL